MITMCDFGVGEEELGVVRGWVIILISRERIFERSDVAFELVCSRETFMTFLCRAIVVEDEAHVRVMGCLKVTWDLIFSLGHALI